MCEYCEPLTPDKYGNNNKFRKIMQCQSSSKDIPNEDVEVMTCIIPPTPISMRQHEEDGLVSMLNLYVRDDKALVESTKAPVIVMERLKDVKKKTSRTKSGFKRKAHNRRFAQIPLAKFQEFVRQKVQTAGKAVETVSPAYTSQTDSRTGRRDGVRRNRRYVCNDGVILDSDWNAAVNIALKSKHPVSSDSTPVDGGLKPLSGQGAVNRPIACEPGRRPRCRRRPCKPTT